jgi:hypothetical protein
VAVPVEAERPPEQLQEDAVILEPLTPPAAASQETAESPLETAVPQSERPALAAGIEAELRSRIATDAAEPVFSILLRSPTGSETTVDVGLGDTVVGDWYVSEHSLTQETVTLYNDQDIAILRIGAPKTLPAAEEEAEAGEADVSQRNEDAAPVE